MKSKFTQEEKQAILDRYISKSESPTSIIKSVGISKSTLYKWLSYYRKEQAKAKRKGLGFEPRQSRVMTCRTVLIVAKLRLRRSAAHFAPCSAVSHCVKTIINRFYLLAGYVAIRRSDTTNDARYRLGGMLPTSRRETSDS